MREDSYMAELAGIHIKIQKYRDNIQINISGFDEGVLKFLPFIISKLKTKSIEKIFE